MSLINQMLKDLEQRRATGLGSGASALQGLHSPLERPDRRRRLIFLATITGLVGLGFIAAQQLLPAGATQSPRPQAIPPALAIDATPSPTPAEAETLANKPLTGLRPSLRLSDHLVRDPVVAIADSPPQQKSSRKAVQPISQPAPKVSETKPAPLESQAEAATSEAAAEPTTVRIKPRADTLEQWINQARYHLSQGQPWQARDRLQQVIARRPGHPVAAELLAGLYLELGQPLQAINVIEQALKAQPKQIPLIELRARIAVDQGDLTLAAKLLRGQDPELERHQSYHALAAYVAQTRQDYSQAAERYRRLVKLVPDKGAYWLGLGIALDGLNDPSQAREAYRRAGHFGASLTPSSRQFVTERLRALKEAS